MQNDPATPFEDRNSGGGSVYGSALILPVCFAGVCWFLRAQAGPMWQWNLLDPIYFYLFDSLNVLNGDPPGHIYHPGVTIHAFGALLVAVKAMLASGDTTAGALADPDGYLRWMSDGFIVLNASGLFVLGVVARRAFGARLPALVCQLAPFMSTIVIKYAFLPRPESMLIFAVTMLIALSVASLREGFVPAGRLRLAVGFGAVAGFTLATKLTAAPVLLLPLFVLRDWRAIVVYGLVSAAAFFAFFAPAYGALGPFVEWVGRIATSTGPHGSGASGVVDWETYPGAVAKILKRPSLKVPLILSLLALAASWLHARRGGAVRVGEIWLVVGTSAAQLAQALFVGKQPTAFYMVPSYMLAALSVLCSVRLSWAARPARLRLPIEPAVAGALLFAVFVAAQTAGLERLSAEYVKRHEEAQSVDNEAFKACARIYVYGASSPVFALYLANKLSGGRFTKPLRAAAPRNDFWIDDWWAWEPIVLRDWDGQRDFAEVRAGYPCVYIRGYRTPMLRRFLSAQPGGLEPFDFSCRAGLEEIAVSGVDCQGRPR